MCDLVLKHLFVNILSIIHFCFVNNNETTWTKQLIFNEWGEKKFCKSFINKTSVFNNSLTFCMCICKNLILMGFNFYCTHQQVKVNGDKKPESHSFFSLLITPLKLIKLYSNLLPKAQHPSKCTLLTFVECMEHPV